MSFPTSPANNQTALVNGIVYQWNNTLGVWKRNGSVNSITVGQAILTSESPSTSNTSGTLIVSGGVGISGNLYSGDVYLTGPNGLTFPDGTLQITAASGSGIDAFARTTANTATDNITIIQGVDTTQNTNIASANTLASSAKVLAQEAYDTANTKFNSTGGTISGDTVVTGNLTVSGTQFYANTVNLTVDDNIITLNSNVTGAPTLDAGLEINRGSSTNTKILWNETTDTWQFTNDGIVYDSFAGLNVVNVATTLAQAAFDKANTETIDAFARTTANTATDNITIIQGVDLSQNTNITAANTLASSAKVLAQEAYDTANTLAANALKTTTSATKPTSNNVGDMWYSTSDDTLYRYTYDGTSNTWIDISGATLISSNIQYTYTITSNVS